MRTALLALTVLLPAAAAAAPPSPPQSPAPADPSAAQGEAIRALAQVSAGEPVIEVLQRAAAREVDRSDRVTAAYPGRSRLAALLPKLTAEFTHDQASNRVVGIQGSGEVDYLRFTPSDSFMVRATWELASLVADSSELTAAAQAQALARRRAEVVEKVTKLFYERQRLRVALALAPPGDPVARANNGSSFAPHRTDVPRTPTQETPSRVSAVAACPPPPGWSSGGPAGWAGGCSPAGPSGPAR